MNKIIQELTTKKNQMWDAAKTFLETSRDPETGLVSAENSAKYDRMEETMLALDKEIDRLKRQEAYDRELAKPVDSPLISRPSTGAVEDEKTGIASNEYKVAMINLFRSNFRKVENIMSEGVDTEGGYLVPPTTDKRIVDVLEEENIMRRLATRITTSSEHRFNVAGTKPAAAWIEEGEAISFGDATFDQIFMDAHKLHVAIKVTEELLYDNAYNLEDYIVTAFGRALANAEEDAFLNGDGKGKPEGLFVAGTAYKTIKNIAADDLVNLVYALKRPYRKNASFIMNDKTIAKIRTLKDNNGSYMWQPSYTSGEPDRILGYPVYTSAFAPEDAVAFGDISYYTIADRGSRSFAELKELFAGNGMIGFLAKERVDGKLLLPEAVQILKVGSTTATA